jgi:hypothetical protein
MAQLAGEWLHGYVRFIHMPAPSSVCTAHSLGADCSALVTVTHLDNISQDVSAPVSED